MADPAELPVALTAARVQLLCDRHRGVGSDGILLLSLAASGAEFGLRIFNPDGSEAEKSGNGIRIFAKWLRDTGRAAAPRFSIHTQGGVVPVEVEDAAADQPTRVEAAMGRPVFREDLASLDVNGERLSVTALSLGNPHCVVPREELNVTDPRRLGPLIEQHSAFPERTNVQFARLVNRGRVEALLWERGAGETLASGSSACAVAAVYRRQGLVDEVVCVSMPGGDLVIRVDADGGLHMRGPAEEIAAITLSAELIARLRALV